MYRNKKNIFVLLFMTINEYWIIKQKVISWIKCSEKLLKCKYEYEYAINEVLLTT